MRSIQIFGVLAVCFILGVESKYRWTPTPPSTPNAPQDTNSPGPTTPKETRVSMPLHLVSLTRCSGIETRVSARQKYTVSANEGHIVGGGHGVYPKHTYPTPALPTSVKPTNQTLLPPPFENSNATDVQSSSASSCRDIHPSCISWAKVGECKNKNYASYMATTCKKSCGYCVPCRDGHNMCSSWAKFGQCKQPTYAYYMYINCKKSCNMCGVTIVPIKPTIYAACGDGHPMCPYWAGTGQCTDKNYAPFMYTNCRKSCGLCRTTTTSVKPTTVVKPTSVPATACRDSNPLCGYWQSIGECSSNERYMKNSCRKTCGLCKDGKAVAGCSDSKEVCKYWASQGECKSNPSFMTLNCRLSCGICKLPPTVCKDDHKNCLDWAKKGECQKNREYMHKTCRKSCRRCL